MTGSVLIVGGGVAGMRAAAELLQQKFRVYLVEKERSLGGKLGTIDRMFPTYEHASCSLQALIPLVVNDKNSTVLTSTEILSLIGTPGSFTVKVRQHSLEGNGDSQDTEFAVGTVIVATGFEEGGGELLGRLGHGEVPNVLTGLEMEWQLSGLGSAGGDPRLANGEPPRSVTWIVAPEDFPVSFMSASVQAMGILERNKDTQVLVLHQDRVTRGRGYEEFCREAEKRGVSYTRTQIDSIESRSTGDGYLALSYGTEAGQTGEIQTHMLVVSAPLLQHKEARGLAEKLDLDLDHQGFFEAPQDGCPILTSREGIFVCGAAQGPKSIGESIIQACAAASRAAILLATARGHDLVPPPGHDVPPIKTDGEPKIAVVIDEGEDILDSKGLSDFTRTLPGVERVEVTQDAAEGSTVRELLDTGRFNRLVVAGPSPITHEYHFQCLAEERGLNRFLLEMVNLHNQCARVHSENPDEADRKARALMRMGIARARRLEPLEQARVAVIQSCLVVGGTPSGVSCASALAAMGFDVHLAESRKDLEPVPNVKVHAGVTPGEVKGCIGDFTVELIRGDAKENVRVGVIVVAKNEDKGDSPLGNDFEISLNLKKDSHGFYEATEGILNPLDTTTPGVFICGSARFSLAPVEAVVDGEAAASRAACIISSEILVRPPVMSHVVDKNCDGCAYCVEPCPMRSITLLEYKLSGETKKVIEVNESTCIGCGICMATCPKEGAFVKHFRSETFSAMVEAALENDEEEDDEKPVIISFCCNRCAYPGADAAGLAGLQYPASVRIIRPVCLGMIHPNVVMDALNKGADGVLLCGCYEGECRSREGIRRALARQEGIQLLLEDFGLEEERFRLEHIAASDGPKFARVIEEMTEELTSLGPNPYKQG
jgi:heterodisulfide reductase subunit A-like polyferredoxin/coenzyme F420-reducing hydrogenase delta subunit